MHCAWIYILTNARRTVLYVAVTPPMKPSSRARHVKWDVGSEGSRGSRRHISTIGQLFNQFLNMLSAMYSWFPVVWILIRIFGVVTIILESHSSFQQPISLEDVANEVNMNKSSFCRYFRTTTQKGFSHYLNEIRIGYACKLLQVSKQRKIAEVCFESGFNNLSNFNDKFKQHTGYTPSDYAQLFAWGARLMTLHRL